MLNGEGIGDAVDADSDGFAPTFEVDGPAIGSFADDFDEVLGDVGAIGIL